MAHELRVWRARRRITQRDLADKAGIGYFRYQLIEQGRKNATPDEEEALSQALDAPRNEVFLSREAVAS